MLKTISLFFLVITTQLHAFQSHVTNSPETYKEAVEFIYNSLNKDTLVKVKNLPFYLSGYVAHENQNLFNSIDTKSSSMIKSCFKANDNKHVHFEDVPFFVMQGVWKKLNPDYINFKKINPHNYFETISGIIENKEKNKIVDIASLPQWIFHDFATYPENERDSLLIIEAEKIITSNKEFSSLAAFYLSHLSPNSLLLKNWLKKKYDDDIKKVTLPEYTHDSKELYKWTNVSLRNFVIRCYGIIYEKKFNDKTDYEAFQGYCQNNYLAYYRYEKTLTESDFKQLSKQPKKLLEILILSQNYYHANHNNDELIYSGYTTTKELVKFLESKGKITLNLPYPKSFNTYAYTNFENDIDNLKAVNALVKVAEMLSIEELIMILKPETKNSYDISLKTDDFENYNTVVAFLIATQYKRLLDYPDKNKIYDLCVYYWEEEFISWPIRYFVAELLIQIDKDRALRNFKKHFEEISADGSFMRQAILMSFIKYDYENNKDFIEKWYWFTEDKDFRHIPSENETILKYLKDTDENTLLLYHKIIANPRYKE